MSEVEIVARALEDAMLAAINGKGRNANPRIMALTASDLAELAVTLAPRLAAIDEARGWRPVAEAQPSLAPGRYEGLICAIRMGDGTPYFSDVYHSWKNPDGTWARWPHDFPPTHHMPLPAPPKKVGQ